MNLRHICFAEHKLYVSSEVDKQESIKRQRA